MTDIPQLGPEVWVDDEEPVLKSRSALLSPSDIPLQSPFLSHGMDGANRQRATDNGEGPSSTSAAASPGVSPRLSPHRPTNSAFSFDGVDFPSPSGSASSSRRGSAVNAENVLEVLDNSAWGESIRRSFTTRRPNDRGSS